MLYNFFSSANNPRKACYPTQYKTSVSLLLRKKRIEFTKLHTGSSKRDSEQVINSPVQGRESNLTLHIINSNIIDAFFFLKREKEGVLVESPSSHNGSFVGICYIGLTTANYQS